MNLLRNHSHYKMDQLFQGISKPKELVDINKYFEDESKPKEFSCGHCGYQQEEVNLEESSLMKLEQEIKNWEGLHWKLKRESIPPSAIPETISEDLKREFGL